MVLWVIRRSACILLDQLNVSQWALFGDGTVRTPGVSSLSLIDPNIKWETTTITNIGVDLGVLDNTLSLVAEYYIKDTKDILLSYPIPSTVGKMHQQSMQEKFVILVLKWNYVTIISLEICH